MPKSMRVFFFLDKNQPFIKKEKGKNVMSIHKTFFFVVTLLLLFYFTNAMNTQRENTAERRQISIR